MPTPERGKKRNKRTVREKNKPSHEKEELKFVPKARAEEKPFTEKAASAEKSDEHHEFLDTEGENREELNMLPGTYRVLSIHIGLNLILCVGLDLG